MFLLLPLLLLTALPRREPFAAPQAMLLGIIGSRLAPVVQEANAIGTTYLRAQTLAELYRLALDLG